MQPKQKKKQRLKIIKHRTKISNNLNKGKRKNKPYKQDKQEAQTIMTPIHFSNQ